MAEATADGPRGDRVKTQQRVHRAIQKHRGQQRADGRGGLGVGIGQPAMHGHKAQSWSRIPPPQRQRRVSADRCAPESWRGGHQRRPIERESGGYSASTAAR